MASMLTPNQFEAELLTGLRIQSEEDGRKACNLLHAVGPSKVVITSINIDGKLLLIGSSLKEKGGINVMYNVVMNGQASTSKSNNYLKSFLIQMGTKLQSQATSISEDNILQTANGTWDSSLHPRDSMDQKILMQLI